jgi:hypothetical protein
MSKFTTVRVDEPVRLKQCKYKALGKNGYAVDDPITGKITKALDQGHDQPTRVCIVIDQRLAEPAPAAHVIWVDFEDVELLTPSVQDQQPLEGHAGKDGEILFEIELFMEEDERMEWKARIEEIKEGRKLYGCDG